MPVYIRKNVNFTPPSIDKIPVEDDDDYITDPDQLKDKLPQPYRMIDKVLTQWFDELWEEIETRENERLEESRKIRPPQYNCAVHMKKYTHAICLCDSVDGRYIFIGQPRGLVAIDAITQERVSLWDEENMEIHEIKCYLIGVQTYLLVTIDDMGITRLHVFGGEKFFFIKAVNEFQFDDIVGSEQRMKSQAKSNPTHSSNEGGTKLLVSECEASKDGDYLGAVFENPETEDFWLEIYKLPRDTWLNELEGLVKKDQEKKEQKEAPKEEEAATETAAEQEVTPAPETESQAAPTQPGKRTGSRTSSRQSVHTNVTMGSQEEPHTTHHDKSTFKFTPPHLVFKLKPPPELTGNLAPTVHASCQKVDSGEVIGTGQNHILTSNHIEMRKDVFNVMHDNLLSYLQKGEEEDEDSYDGSCGPTFHFMTAGRLVPFGLEHQSNAGLPTTVAVWWAGSTQLMQYSLVKQHKDPENIKPDLVWPYTSKITATTISSDSSLIAIGLENGNAVIWDRYLGIPYGTVSVTDSASIQQLNFLDPSICPQVLDDSAPYPTKTSTYLMVLSSDGGIYVLTCGQGIQLDAICISPPIEQVEDRITRIEPIRGIPNLLVTVLTLGQLQIRDALQGKVLCELVFPKAYQMMNPWDPIISIGGMGQMLYVKGYTKFFVPGDDGTMGSEYFGYLFVYQLRSFPTLDPYIGREREPVPFMVHSTADKRVDALMKERIALQGLRKTRMQERWVNLKEEIWSILQYKDQAERKADNRPEIHFKTIRNYSQTNMVLMHRFMVQSQGQNGVSLILQALITKVNHLAVTPGSMGWTPFFKEMHSTE